VDVFSIILGSSLVDVKVCDLVCVGEYGGKLFFFNFLVVLEKTPRVRFPLGPNYMSAVRGEDGLSAGTISNK
jgi:hypothetical protein